MSNGELNIAIIGLLCLVGILAVAVETRLHRRKLREESSDAHGGGKNSLRRDSGIATR